MLSSITLIYHKKKNHVYNEKSINSLIGGDVDKNKMFHFIYLL